MRIITKKLKKGLFNTTVILMLVCMVFAGCVPNTSLPDNGDSVQNEEHTEDNGSINTNQSLEDGFNINKNTSVTSKGFYCAYKSEKNEFEIDDVTLDFYYGGCYYLGAEYKRETTHDFPIFDIYFDEDSEEAVLVKHVEENLVLDKYNVVRIYDENMHIKELEYNFSETFTIPKQLFSKEKGEIYFYILGSNVKLGDKAEQELITSIKIFYKVIDGKVILSNTDFK